MKAPQSQSHYDTLEIPRGSPQGEVERAYRVASATYGDGSLAVYSVFDGSDAAAIREQIDVAYAVLRDPETRRAYDASLTQEPAREPGEDTKVRTPSAAPPISPDRIEGLHDLASEAEAEEGGPYDGPRLRRARMRRGIELDQIAALTKISKVYLGFLEEESFDDLPAPVYVRGFVSAYARAIGLDIAEVATSYMAGYASVQGEKSGGGRPGRK